MTFRFPLIYILGSATTFLVLGVVLPLLMVLRVLEPSFLLSFVSFAAIVAGSILGHLGVISLFLNRRRPPQW